MSSVIIFNDIEVKDSVISSGETTTTKDNTAPFSFLEFITNTGVDYSPEQYNKFYLYYLEKWADYKNSSATNDTIKFTDLYIDFLKELTLTYSTQQEQRFLSTLDYTNPVDLDVAIPFYVEKIRQVILFYKEKRDTAKFVIERNKIKGTSLSVERALYEKIYDYVFASQNNPLYSTVDFSLSGLQSSLKIDLQEFVDVYSEYFDLPVGTDPFTAVNREDINVNLFFDDPFAVFRNEIFLSEIPLAVNASISFNEACDPTNPVTLLKNECENKSGFTDDEKTALKIKYLEKYMGVDLHYIDTTATPPVSGVLFRAETPTNNIQNLQNVYTPTAESNQIKLLRDIGLFFKPDKTGIFQLNSNSYTYAIDPNKIESGKIYIYPDPSIYGNVTINKQTEYPLIFTYDNRVDIKNVSSSFSSGDPDISNTDQTFSPYYSREQSTLRTQAKDTEYSLNFNDLYNKGYITKYQTDIYGNEYALFKDNFGQTFKDIEEYETQPVLNLLLNGHAFYDRKEGFEFDYSISSREGNTVRSGLSTLTVNYPFSPSSPTLTPSFILSGSPWFLYFREFLPYQELNYSDGFIESVPYTKNYIGAFRDGGGFTFVDGTKLPDPMSSDAPGFPGSNSDVFYYQLLVNATGSKPTDAVIVTQASVNITDQSGLDLQTEPIYDYDCGYFTDVIKLDNDYNYGSSYNYYDNIFDNSKTIISSITGNDTYRAMTYKQELEGKLFVKNATKAYSQPVSAALNAIFGKYSSNITSEVYEAPKNIEIFNDSICIETTNFLVIDKIKYEEGEFITESTKNNAFTLSSKDLSVFSNRFYKEKDNTLIFCTIQQTETLSARNSKGIYPKIYQFDLNTNTTKTLYPKTTDLTTLSSVFNLSSVFTGDFNINIVSVERPVLTYNTFNDVYKLTYIAVDNNNYFHIFDIEFDIINDEVKFLGTRFYKADKKYLTTSFTNSNTIFTNINAISGSYTLNTNSGVLSL
jgi:hypothetical protein